MSKKKKCVYLRSHHFRKMLIVRGKFSGNCKVEGEASCFVYSLKDQDSRKENEDHTAVKK